MEICWLRYWEEILNNCTITFYKIKRTDLRLSPANVGIQFYQICIRLEGSLHVRALGWSLELVHGRMEWIVKGMNLPLATTQPRQS